MLAKDIFRKGGLIDRKTPNYEVREGQIRMAEMVESAIKGKTDAIAEAACGIGKSFAYLVPSMLSGHSAGKTIVVATANIALQEQIAFKDAPFIKDILVAAGAIRANYSIAQLKGRGNYVCKNKMRIHEESGNLINGSDDVEDQLSAMCQWVASPNCTGDISDLAFVPLPFVRYKLLGDSETCLGSKCGNKDACFYQKARERALESDMIIVNYSLLFSHFSLVGQTGGNARILPEYDVLICDEAHEIPDIGRSFWEISVSPFGLRQAAGLLDDLSKEVNGDTMKQKEKKTDWRLALRGLRSQASILEADLRAYYDSDDYREILREPNFIDCDDLVLAIDAVQTLLYEHKSHDEKEKAKCDMAKSRLDSTMKALDVIMNMKDPNMVYAIEPSKKSIRMKGSPIDVSVYIKKAMFDDGPACILTSATLATERNFEFIKKQIGMGKSLEMIEDSPFDMKKQAMIVCPRMEYLPNEEGFIREIADKIEQIIKQVGGRTLVLFTSYKNLEGVYERIRDKWPYLLKQGDMSRKMLREEFKRRPETVLLATSSFWTGIDIQGESLTCLVIDKLPFENMSEPVNVWIRENVHGSFGNYSIPRAAITFKQGFGRLIRTKTDVGVCVVLDKRLLEKGYGKSFLRSLPEMTGDRRIESIREFLEKNGVSMEVAETPPHEEPEQEEFDYDDEDDPF